MSSGFIRAIYFFNGVNPPTKAYTASQEKIMKNLGCWSVRVLLGCVALLLIALGAEPARALPRVATTFH